MCIILRIGLSLTICASLLVPGVSLFVSEASQGQNGARPARSNRPDGTFPNLDEIKNESHIEREPPAPIPSTVRAKRNQGKPWDGRRVGEPFTPGNMDQLAANGGEYRKRQSRLKEKLIRRAHAGRRPDPPPTVLDSQFIQNFFNVALLRNASSDENSYWSYHLRAGYNVEPASLKLAAIEMGRTVFESAGYAARNLNAHWYVYDLYKTYLMRDPDAGGWAMWEGLVSSHGREYVRRGFEESGEFATLMASIVPAGAGSANASSLISAMVDPRNQPGNGMLTRDASWTVPLLSLPGRNGLDLGLSLSYSSMVWTRSGPYFYFDQDNGFPSPGFRLGFPTVQRKVFDAQTSKNSYLLLTPSGHRVQLRQVSATVYEAADSSYLQLSENGANLLVRSTNGTQLTFVEANNEYRCTQIKDRNGNYITVNYNALGHITTITDTLGRVITFNYDSNANLLSITQSWAGQPSHQWVSFGWSTRNMQHSFSNDAVIGIANGTVVPVITQVALNDTSRFSFDYTNALQVSAVRNHFDVIERNATSYTYQTASGDVPRLSSSSVSARNWSGYNNVPAQVTTQYSVDVDGACVLTAPDGTIYKEYYGTGWQKGLTVRSEVLLGSTKQKWTTMVWTQDDPSLTYPLNPRVTEINVYDGSDNRRRTTIHYDNSQYRQYGLPSEVREYAADPETVLRQTFTDYELSPPYLERRIIGLVSKVQLTNGSQYLTKTTYSYDDPARLQGLPASATQHDGSYSTSFTSRGNVTAVSRWDVNDINNQAKRLTSFTNYYTTGTPASTTDASGHQSSVTYTDSFSDGILRNTFAYPTTLTDAGNFSSQVQYNFDFGATTRTESPAPEGQSQGLIQTMNYNGLGQLERITTTNNGAYRRFWYGAEFTASYATVNNVADEAYSVQVTDGMGRVIGALNNHPGSTGGYSLVNRVYDRMGRVWLRSNPTEVNSSWVTTGDDAAGINYTQQTYDWKGRPLVTTNPDLTTKQVSYSSCGCAGSDVMTVTDEGTTLVGGAIKKRQQKIYFDVLGRVAKEEVLNWDGAGPNGTGGTVYATTTIGYNALNQMTQVRRFAGSASSSTFQEMTRSYDGYGRLKTEHLPHQQPDPNNSASTDHYTWNYNTDDTIQNVVDARGVVTRFSYNARHLITGIVYDRSNVPASANVLPTESITLGYDAAGNRTSMSDGSGAVDYHYDQLSRMDWEERTFSGLPTSGNYRLTYEYSVGGLLKKVTDQRSNTSFTLTLDDLGRVTAVDSTALNGVQTQFASQIKYRAWGALRSRTQGNNALSLSYNGRGLVTNYSVAGFGSSYAYHNDGTIKFVDDQSPWGGDSLKDRAYSFDAAGRVKETYSGVEARQFVNNTSGGTPDGPFRHSYTYDHWDNVIDETGRFWSRNTSTQATYNVTNRNPAWSYDGNGNLLSRNEIGGITPFQPARYNYDAAGREVGSSQTRSHLSPDGTMTNTFVNTHQFDGDGQLVHYSLVHNSIPESAFILRSTVLGGLAISEYKPNGSWKSTSVYAGGEKIGQQRTNEVGGSFSVWQNFDPVTGDGLDTVSSGSLFGRSTLDDGGVNVGDFDPFAADGSTDPDGLAVGDYSPASKGGTGLLGGSAGRVKCVLDGLEVDCTFIRGETSVQCQNNDCGPRRVVYQGQPDWAFFRAYGDGYSGYVPRTARYIGNGGIAPAGSGGRHRFSKMNPRTRFDTDLGRLNGASGPEEDLRHSYSAHITFLQSQNASKVEPTEAENLLTNECVHFLNSILAELGSMRDPHNYNFAGIFRTARDRGVFRSIRLSAEQLKKRLGGVTSTISDPSLRIEVDERLFNRSDFTAGYIIIHELFHASPAVGPWYTHEEMAVAAYNVALSNDAVMKKLKNYGTPGPPKSVSLDPSKYNEAHDWYNAGVFDAVVRIGCPIPPK